MYLIKGPSSDELQSVKARLEHSFNFGHCKTKDGASTTYFIDGHVALSDPHILFFVSKWILERVEKSNIEMICGMGTGAIPIVASVMSLGAINKVHIHGYYIPKETRKYGLEAQVLRERAKGRRVALVDDVISSGRTLINCIEHLRQLEVDSVSVYALINRNRHKEELFQKIGVPVETLYTIDDFKTFIAEKMEVCQ